MPKKTKQSQQKQIAKLTSALANLELRNSSPKPAKPRRRKANAKVAGDVTISRHEIVKEITLLKDKGTVNANVDIFPSSFSFLAKLSDSFERYRFTKCRFYWKPAVGMTYGGLVSYGCDWNFSSNKVSRKDVAGLTPNSSHAVWQDTERRPLVLPTSRLMSRAWYSSNTDDNFSKGPGRIIITATGEVPTSDKPLGELWVDYTITFSGTQP